MAEGRKADPAATVAGDAPPEKSIHIPAPDWLDGDALKIRQVHAPVTQSLKLLSEADINAFARYCQNFASWDREHEH